MKMIHYYNKLKELKVEIGEDTLIWRVLQSLPPQFDVMRTSYNTQKAEWTIDEMIAIITQEEETFKKGKEQSVQFAAASTSGTKSFRGNNYKGRNHHHDKKKGKATHNLEPKKKIFKGQSYKGICKYCKSYGHKVDDCFFLKRKLEKQGKLLALACFEFNIVDVPSDTWWLDS
ncbi:hypothetical protein L195_g058835, partial [Trifolium pratense]